MESKGRHLVYVSKASINLLISRLRDEGWHVDATTCARDVRIAAQRKIVSLGFIDYSTLPHNRDIDSLNEFISIPNIRWVSATTAEQLNCEILRRSIRDHCFYCVTAPHEDSHVIYSINRAFRMSMTGEFDAKNVNSFDDECEMVGSSSAMQALFRTIGKVAKSDASVFIFSEYGTGKELTATEIHKRSGRADSPFVVINCDAIPPQLLQSELFGYERGAFTGATHRKIGRLEEADGGTLFLDEIGDMQLESQVNLLRFLEERKLQRLGGRDSIMIDARIISATHCDIEQMVREGRFRSDLYHRLCVLSIKEPPLRERGQDIELLAWHMLDRYKNDPGRRLHGLSADAVRVLHSYD